jgi:hypothetical protein
MSGVFRENRTAYQTTSDAHTTLGQTDHNPLTSTSEVNEAELWSRDARNMQ